MYLSGLYLLLHLTDQSVQSQLICRNLGCIETLKDLFSLYSKICVNPLQKLCVPSECNTKGAMNAKLKVKFPLSTGRCIHYLLSCSLCCSCQQDLHNFCLILTKYAPKRTYLKEVMLYLRILKKKSENTLSPFHTVWWIMLKCSYCEEM